MPYIKQEDREKVLNYGVEPYDMSPGQHNFLLTSLVYAWLGSEPNYATYERIIGRLELIKMELFRRQIAPYEDQKIKENGDLNGCDTSVDSPVADTGGLGCSEGVVWSGSEEVAGTDGGRGDQT